MLDADNEGSFRQIAASVANACVIKSALERLLRPLDGRISDAERNEYWALHRLIASTNSSEFIKAILSRKDTSDPHEIGFLCDLIARHGEEDRKGSLPLSPSQTEEMTAALKSWVQRMIVAPKVRRFEMAEVARAVARFPYTDLLESLINLFKRDLAMRREQREIFMTKGRHDPESEHSSDHGGEYGAAFTAIGGDIVIELMESYLYEADYCGFGKHAAQILRNIWAKEAGVSQDNPFWPFVQVSKNNAAPESAKDKELAAFYSEKIFRVIEALVVSPDVEVQSHALELARIGLTITGEGRSKLLQQLLDLPLAIRRKQNLLRQMANVGKHIPANLLKEGIEALLLETKSDPWRLQQENFRLYGWLELFPYSDEPTALIGVIDKMGPTLIREWEISPILGSLQANSGPATEECLLELLNRYPGLKDNHQWTQALLSQDKVFVANTILEEVWRPVDGKRHGGMGNWGWKQKLAELLKSDVSIRARVYARFGDVDYGGGPLVAEAIAEAPDDEGILMVLEKVVRQGGAYRNSLFEAIRNRAVNHVPSDEIEGAQELVGSSVALLRQELFRLVIENKEKAGIARQALSYMDELRDEYGLEGGGRRHPALEMGQPWPQIAVS